MTQPKALFLADVLHNDPASKSHHDEAAFELRRLHAQRDALLEALAVVLLEAEHTLLEPTRRKARAAIKAVEPVAKIIATAPKRIWLDLGFDPAGEEITFDQLLEATWSQDNATGWGIEYVRADLAQQAEPLTIARLRDALVASRIIPPAAVEDPEGYDDGVTLHRIEALHRRIT